MHEMLYNFEKLHNIMPRKYIVSKIFKSVLQNKSFIMLIIVL